MGAVLLVVALVAGCAPPPITAPPTPPPDSVARTVPRPTDCDATFTDPAGAQLGLDRAEPGERVCLLGPGLRAASLTVTRSGTADSPIEVLSDGSTVRELGIEADDVTVQGLNTRGGDGITARGARIVLRDNDVRGAADGGITCAPCTGAVVDGNVVRDAEGIGVEVRGQNVVALFNDIAGTRPNRSGNTEGIRFAGVAVRVLNNSVHDIRRKGPADQAPEADCLRTGDADGVRTTGALAQYNRCAGVDGHCLVASAPAGGGAGQEVAVAVRFLDNFCQTGSDQAIALDGFGGVTIIGNVFSGAYRAAVALTRGSVGVRMSGNTLVGGFPPAEVDASSRPGFTQSDDITR